jgi:hypothetical protein
MTTSSFGPPRGLQARFYGGELEVPANLRKQEYRFHTKARTRGADWPWPQEQESPYPAAEGLDAGVLEGLLSRLTLQVMNTERRILELLARVEHLEDSVAELKERPQERLVELFDLPSDRYQLRRSVLVNIEEYEDETLARWPMVEMSARGASEPVALRALGESIIELYEELVSEADNLGEAPRRWLAVLSSAISPRGQA